MIPYYSLLEMDQAINQKGYTHVRFRRGYTYTMLFELKDIVIGKGNIDWDKFMNNPFIKVHIKWLQFLEYAREHNKKVIILNRRDKL